MSAFLRCALSALFACAFVSTPSIAADPAAGREKAGQCATCHGKDGIATAPDAPNLAGMSAIYTSAQLKAFKAGERQHQQMSIIAQSLSEDDIADLAAWYETIEVTATLPAE
ncbi:cytochrome c [Fulvimarina sp. MAC8]|uniref:c-type cytochrome n=1 Tax=Fulvimarina sp. MAC8 TaxID=3162874 RepID=UPI0032EC67B5